VASANGLFRLKRRRKSKNIRQRSQYTDPNSDLKTFSGMELTNVQFKGAIYSSHTRIRRMGRARERRSNMKRFKKGVRKSDNIKIHITLLFRLIILILREITNVSVSQIPFIRNPLLSTLRQIFFNES
jgi:hypothetical protein